MLWITNKMSTIKVKFNPKPSKQKSNENQDVLIVHDLPDRLRKERKRRKLTLAEVSAETGLTISTLSRIENGVYKPRAETFMELLSWLGLDLNQVNLPKRKLAPIDTMTQMALLLKSDPLLNEESVNKLLRAWRPMYELYVEHK